MVRIVIRRVKSYLVFTSILYRVVMFAGLPAALLGIYCIIENVLLSGVVKMVVIISLLLSVEIVSDYWMFGGIQAKDAVKMDFLRTSGKGMQVMRSALVLDLARKFLLMAGMLVLCNLRAFLVGDAVMGVWSVLLLVLFYYFFSVVSVLITRFFSELWCNVLVANVSLILEVLCCVLPGLPGAAPGYCVVFGVLGVGVSILAVRIAMKKVKAQYAG